MKQSRQNRFFRCNRCKNATPPMSKIPHSLFYHGHVLDSIAEEEEKINNNHSKKGEK
jgi:hypothetical protein